MTIYHAFRQRGAYGNRVPGLIDLKAKPSVWWKLGGVSDGNVLAVYLPKGAESYAASKINLSNPGTYDLSDVNAPSWAEGTGWLFDGSNDNLSIGNGGFGLKPGTIIARLARDVDWSASQTFVGGTVVDLMQFTIASSTPYLVDAGQGVIGNANTALTGTDHVIAASYDASGNYAFYLDGSADGSGTNNRTIGNNSTHIGRNYDGKYFDNYIYALAFYSAKLTPTQIIAIMSAMEEL